MPIFEQRRAFDAKAIAKDAGVNVNDKNKTVFLENTGNESDLLRQRNIYFQEHYDQIGRTEMGIFMEISPEQAEANERRMADESSSRLEKPTSAGLPDEFQETPSKVKRAKKQGTADEFLASSDDPE